MINKVATVVTYTIGQSNISLTGLMALVRLIQIRFPFWAFSHGTHIFRLSVATIVLDIIYNTTAITVYILCYKHSIFLSVTQTVWALSEDMISFQDPNALNWVIWMFFSGPYYVKTGLTLLTSILTMLALRTSDEQEGLNKSQHKSIVTILILNLAPLLWIMLMIASQVILDTTKDPTNFTYSHVYLIYLSFVGMPVFLTAYNPLVLCCRSSGIRKMMTSWRDSSRFVAEWYSVSRTHLLRNQGMSTTESTVSPVSHEF